MTRDEHRDPDPWTSERVLYEALAYAAAAPRLLVACDFDGTLSELIDDPAAAMPVPGAVEALEVLARADGVSVAIVSGRGRLDLVGRLGALCRVRLWGSYGTEPDTWEEAADPRERVTLRRIADALDEVAAACHGATVERKPFGVAFHVRMVTAARRWAALASARAAVRATTGAVPEAAGHDVVEFLVRKSSKGDALRVLARDADAVVFFGDDEADEQVFAQAPASWITVRVGRRDHHAGATFRSHARLGVAAPRDVVHALACLERSRRGTGEATVHRFFR